MTTWMPTLTIDPRTGLTPVISGTSVPADMVALAIVNGRTAPHLSIELGISVDAVRLCCWSVVDPAEWFAGYKIRGAWERWRTAYEDHAAGRSNVDPGNPPT